MSRWIVFDYLFYLVFKVYQCSPTGFAGVWDLFLYEVEMAGHFIMERFGG